MAASEVDDWDSHWRSYADSASQNPAEGMRYRLVRRALQLNQGDVRLVDIGSGQGDFLAGTAAMFPHIDAVGLELSKEGVAIATAKAPSVRFEQIDLLDEHGQSDLPAAWANRATCIEVLEHLDEPVRLLRNAKRFLAPGCRLVVTVPGGPRSAFDRHIGHRRHFTRQALKELLTDAGFVDVAVSGWGFPFFNLYRLLVVARGQRLIQDVESGIDVTPSRGVAVTMRAFATLFRLTVPSGGLGWQLVATAKVAPA
jgi:SAM-dependent methyltransferase